MGLGTCFKERSKQPATASWGTRLHQERTAMEWGKETSSEAQRGAERVVDVPGKGRDARAGKQGRPLLVTLQRIREDLDALG